MKFLRFAPLLLLPWLFTGCVTWKTKPKDAPTTTAESAAGPAQPAPSSATSAPVSPDTPAAPTAANPRTAPASVDLSSAYGSVRRHGRLYAVGNRIVGEHGMPVSLAGNSFFWSQWAPNFYNASVVRWLKQDWKSALIRVVVGVEHNGYLTQPDEEFARACLLIDAAIANDLYVIIDWHDHRAHQHTAQAVEFFDRIARRYGHLPHLIYEIYNEPLGDASWSVDVKPYAETLIAVIRAVDPDNLIIVGSPNWSQDVDVAAEDPIAANNIAYSLHFYAGTHKEWLRNKALKALRKGLPLFVTEWGTCNADGKGAVNEDSVREWMDFMQEWGLSHCNWSVADKDETSSIVKPGSSPTGHWSDADLTPSGRLAREWIRSWAAAANP